jgi:hypothetical protein
MIATILGRSSISYLTDASVADLIDRENVMPSTRMYYHVIGL